MRVALLVLLLASCKGSTATGAAPSASTASAPPPAAAAGEAPDFELADLDGTKHTLSALRGKRVVLEWFNPGCPFVKHSHTKGSLKDFHQKAIDKGVVWLAINSSAAGREGHGLEANKAAKEKFAMRYPVLLDPDGKVGHAYGATNTPHMFVIDEKGTLVYKGAIDNSPDGEGESPTDGKLINYVEQALDDLAAGRPVKTRETKAYGCSVKYAKS
jgi:peroxiredoxin